jgi:predicted metal-dependent hydrolase
LSAGAAAGRAFRRGIEQFNTGRFFDAHETWEEVWLRSPEPEKTFLQGIIQVAAAFHHHSRGNLRGARSLLKAGLGRLAGFPGVYRGIALGALRATVQAWANALEEGRSSPERPIPRIELAEND